MSDELETLDISPSTHLIQSLATQSLTYSKALCEMIDNSLDAGATTVTIEFGKPRKDGAQHILVSDNGEGCKSLVPLVRFGSHEPHDKKRNILGRYGIGAKDAMLWLGGVDSCASVKSVHGGVVRRLNLRWADLCKSSSWTVKASDILRPDKPSAPGDIGTHVMVKPVIRRVPEGKEWDKLLELLGYIYTPAINDGKQIVLVNGRRGQLPTPLTQWHRPELEPGYVNETIDVNGKRAQVCVGIVADGVPNERPGITYFHGFRVIQAASSRGCAPYGVRRISGSVRLSREWTLNKNKDGVAKDENALYGAVFDACKSVLERAECRTQQLESAALLNRAESFVNNVLAPPNTKAKRDKGSTHGTKRPTGDGAKHKNAKQTQPGHTFTKGLRGNVRIELIEWPNDERIGHYELGGSVLVNKSHPAIQGILDAQNDMGLVQVVLALVGSWHAVHPLDNRGQGLLRMDRNGDMVEQFALFYGRALLSAVVDGKSILEAAKAVVAASAGTEG